MPYYFFLLDYPIRAIFGFLCATFCKNGAKSMGFKQEYGKSSSKLIL